MENTPYIITIQSDGIGQLSAEFRREAAAFEKSQATVLGIDLSIVSILTSEHLGLMATLIMTARRRKGTAVVLAVSDSLYELLDMVNMDTTATIVRDKQDFTNAIAKLQALPDQSVQSIPKPLPSGPADQKKTATATDQAPNQTSNSILKPVGKPMVLGAIVTAVILLLIIVGLVLVVFVQNREYQKLRDTSAAAYLALSRQNDSLSTIQQHAEEERLLMELEIPPDSLRRNP